MSKSPKKRLDQLCTERALTATRARAQALILAGKVLVDGKPVSKAGARFAEDCVIELKLPDHPYVSRGGLKLEAALTDFELSLADRVVLDVGASTGGFTDCALQHGARHVIAVDVGYGQLDWKLRQDARVTVIERTNMRTANASELAQKSAAWPPEVAIIDVSFISLKQILPAVEQCLPVAGDVIALIKPQFEAGRDGVGKGGVVRDPELRQQIIEGVIDWANARGYRLRGGCDSPIAGPKGNVEYLVWLQLPATAAQSEPSQQ